MDEQRLKQAVLEALVESVDAAALARAVGSVARAEPAAADSVPPPEDAHESATLGATKILTRVVLGDILDDAILAARPQDRTFPLRLFFGELSHLLSLEADDGPEAHVAEQAFTVASGLNFFFRAPMDGESKARVGLEVSRQVYALAASAQALGRMDAELVGTAAPLLAALMTQELDRVRFESVDHAKVFDSSVHERAEGSDPTSARVLRPASFLCRVTTNNAVKMKAQVVT